MNDSIRNQEPVLLDWSKLLGFDQFSRSGVTTGLQDPACAKVGNKPSPAARLPAPNCAKVGVKTRPA